VELPGALPDVLVDDGQYLYLRDKVLDLEGRPLNRYVPHLFAPNGLLDGSWWHRGYWLWGERYWGRASGWAVASRYRPSGRILVTDESSVFGYGRKTVKTSDLSGYRLFRAAKQVKQLNRRLKNNNQALVKYQLPAKVTFYWQREVPLVVRALLLADNGLVAAGPCFLKEQDGPRGEPLFDDPNRPALLVRFDRRNGQELARMPLPAQPVFDGLAAAYGRLFVSCVDGTLVCLGAASNFKPKPLNQQSKHKEIKKKKQNSTQRIKENVKPKNKN